MSKISAGKTIIDVHDGIGIESITGNYLATNENEGVTIETKGWSETPQEMNEISKYLWSYETIVLTDGHVQNTRPVLIGVYGDEGVGIEEVIEYYLISDQDSGISHTDDWDTAVPTMTSEEKYLWNYEKIIFTDGTRHESNPVLIGVYGDKGTSVKAIRNFYLATSARVGVTRETSGFTPEMKDLTPHDKYLWNYEIVDYENPKSSIPTEPVIIGVYGDKGEDAKLITLESSAQIFSRSEEGDVSPKKITMEGKTQSTSISQWEYSVDGLSFTSSDIPAGLSRTGNQITIDGSKVVNRSIAVRATDGTFSDTVTVAVVEDGETGSSGSNAIIGYLTNENITLGADSQGVVSSYDEAVGSFRVLDGIEDVTETEQTSFSVASEGGLTITISSSGEYSVSGMDSDSGKAELKAVYKGTELIKSLTVSKSRAGGRGRDGYTPVKDVDYFDGEDGQDGASSYTYIRYSQSSDGSDMDTNPSNAKYIGIAVTESSTPPQNNTGYNWSKLQGDQGVRGEEGEDGVSSFLHIKYSNDGSSFTGNNGENLGAYIGMYVDDKPGDSTDPSHYTWNLIKGDKGDKGDEGTGVKSAVVAYRNHTSGTETPPTTGWDENPPTPEKGQYMWTRTITTYTDNSNITTYSVAYNAIDGGDGKGITTTTVSYAISTSGSTTPTDWLSKRPTPDQGDYMWTRTVIKYTDGTESTAYNTSYSATDGQKGDKGDTGDDGIGITGITEHYLITDKSSGVTKTTDGWTTDIPKMSDTKPYLWNYEETHLSNGEKESTEPVIMGHYGSDGSDGHDGRGIKEVTEYYLTSSSNSGVSREADGWSTAMKVTTPSERYLWNYGKIEYTEGDPTYTEPVIIGVHGEKGDRGENAPLVKLSGDTQIIATDKDGNTTPANSFAVVGSSVNTSISKWEYSVDGNSFTTSTPTGVARSGNTVTINPKESTFTTLSIKATDGTVSDIFTIGKAVDGATGQSGKDAYTILLTNESHTFAGSETSALIGSTTTSVLAYKGTERIVSSVNSVSGVPNGMTYDISGNGTEDNKVIFNVNTSMKTLDGNITISLTIDGKEFEKQFSYALALKGERGQRGLQGVEGEKGEDGKTTYTWIRYADNANGGNMSNSPVGKDYIGLAHNKETSVESSVAGEYTWSLFRGPQGGQGVEGPPGDDGKPTYTWIRYSANANGSGLTSTPQSNTQYIGIATNKSAQTPSDTPGDYTWSLFKGPKGEKGDDGYTPVKGTDYFDGKDGQDGESSYLWVRYSDSSSGSGMRTDPEGAEYIGTATTSEAVAPKEPGAYDWVLVKGKDGLAGEIGNDGETSYLHIKYSNDGGKTLTGNSGEDAGEWIGTYVDFVKEDSLNTDFYTWNKVKGEKGDQGEDGDDAVLGVLDNEFHAIPTDADGHHGNYVGANASMIIFNGPHEDTGNWKFSMKPSDGVTGSQTMNTYTVLGLSEDTGTVTFKAENKDESKGYSDVIKVFTLTKSKQGHKGEDATAYSLVLDSQVIQKDGRDDSLTPGSLSISGQKQVGEGDFNPFPGYFVIYEQSRESMTVDEYTSLALTGDVGEDEYILSSSAYPYVVRYRSDDLESDIDYDIFKDPMNIRIDWYKDSDYTILLDRAVVPVVSDGKDAIVGMLTNEAMTFPADKEGKVVSYANNSGQFMIYDGARDVSEYTKFDIINPKNVVITIDERGYYSIRGMTDGIGILDGEAILTASYKDIVIQKTVVVSKSLAGDDGDSATSYWISPSVNTVTKHVDESIDPKTITFNAMSKTGEEDPKGYSGRFVVQISNDGVSYSNDYTSSRNASSYTYSVPEDTSFIKAKLYQAGGLVHLLDEETIPVLQEIKGEDGPQGPRGLEGLQGPEGKQGIQGLKGEDGLHSYTHIAYATGTQGQSFNHDTFPQATYIGVYVSPNQNSSGNWQDYKWTLIKGSRGEQGLPGKKGDDGRTPYFHTAWANNSTGTSGFSTTVSTDKLYIGTATTFEEDDPEDPTKYNWTLIKGDKGDKGDTGDRGPQGIQGPEGKDGQSQYVHMRYSANANGSGFIDSPDSNTKYIGIAVTASSTAPTGASSYTWSKFIGENGNQGVQGPPGPSGKTTYTWVKYADDVNGNGIDDSPSGKMFIGLAFNQTTQSETDEPSDYTWSAIYDEEALEELRTESESLQEQMGNYVPESSYSEDIGEINQSLIDYQDALELAKEQIYGMFDDEGNLVLDDDNNPVQPGVMRDIATLLERTVALQEDFGEKTVQWGFLDTKFVYGDEGMFIGEPDTLTGIMISPATSNEPSRIDFLDGDREKPVAFITSDLMRINRGIFVESATIGEHMIHTQLDGHTIWQWIP